MNHVLLRKLFLNNPSDRVKTGLTFVLCFISFLLIQGQSTSRYPINLSERWKISNITFYPISSEEEVTEKYEYFIDSDTLINSLNYYKLYKSGVAYYDTPFYYDSIYVGAIRDDNNKFYFIHKDKTNEILLHDFNLKLGDTIKSEIGKGHIINGVDSLDDGRKCFTSLPEMCGGCCTTITLIEGIGHSGGIMEDPPCFHIGNYGHYLNCFSDNDVVIYENNMAQVTFDNFADKRSRFPIKSTSEWRVNYEEMDYDTTHRNGDELFTYFIDNDTLINTNRYYKLYKTGIAYYDSPFPVNHLYIGAIRDEDNQLFFVEKNSTKENILYDFNMVAGDTISSSIEKGMVVTSIETLPDGRKKINIKKTDFQLGKCENFSNTYFIEGIGSMGGLMFESPCNHVGFRENYLVCYKENDTLVYQSSLSPFQCDKPIMPPLNSRVKSSGKISIYPVPADNKVNVEFTELNPDYLTVYNLSGMHLFSKSVTKDTNLMELDISCLKNGIYLVKLCTDFTCLTQKFVVERK